MVHNSANVQCSFREREAYQDRAPEAVSWGLDVNPRAPAITSMLNKQLADQGVKIQVVLALPQKPLEFTDDVLG